MPKKKRKRRESRLTIPPLEVLAERADEINRLLREARVHDAFRPAVVGAIMLALWQSKGNLRKDEDYLLQDINEACKKAFRTAKNPHLQESLRVDEANKKLAGKARCIVSILERLNVHVLTAEHDYLGQLYETLFHYIGGNTIGQYFTPRHIAKMMVDLVEVNSSDIVFDPACGTGGFLVAAMNRILVNESLSRAQMVNLVKKSLIGMDSEPITAALCVTNMILRGEGSTGVHHADCFSSTKFPASKATIVLMNPPFPHEGTDTTPEDFVDRALEGLQQGGTLAGIVPKSLFVKKGAKAQWRQTILKQHTLLACIGLPDEQFQPHASVDTAVLVIKKGTPHKANRKVFFARIHNDGFKRRKQVRVPIEGEEISSVVRSFLRRESVPGLCGWEPVGDVWGAGLYIPPRPVAEDELIAEALNLVRSQSAFSVRYAPQLRVQEAAIAGGELEVYDYPAVRGVAPEAPTDPTVGGQFHIITGQRTLHSKKDLEPGRALVVSSSGTENGFYGFFSGLKDNLIEPVFATVPSTGSFGEAHVQEWPCGVADDCLLLFPKRGVPEELLYIAAAVVRHERWRFSYGMKLTADRISSFPLPMGKDALSHVRSARVDCQRLQQLALEAAEDEADALIARVRLVD